jgi:hypothetical protein
MVRNQTIIASQYTLYPITDPRCHPAVHTRYRPLSDAENPLVVKMIAIWKEGGKDNMIARK